MYMYISGLGLWSSPIDAYLPKSTYFPMGQILIIHTAPVFGMNQNSAPPGWTEKPMEVYHLDE